MLYDFFNKEEKITKNECICGIEMNESKKNWHSKEKRNPI